MINTQHFSILSLFFSVYYVYMYLHLFIAILNHFLLFYSVYFYLFISFFESLT